MSDIAMLSVDEVKARLGAPNTIVVDVRLPFDYYGGRIPGAISLPGSMILERVGQIAADRKLIFVCDDGEQSTESAEIARDAGFNDIAVLAGGLDAWMDADLPMESASDGINLPAPD